MEKTKKKMKINFGLIAAFLIIAILAGISITLKNQNEQLIQTINNSYGESFYELMEYVDNVKTLLTKAQISSTPEYSAKTLTEVWREANLAESSLSKLPITHISLENAVKFLNQVSDYSYYLSKKTIENNSLNEEEFANLKRLQEQCEILNETLVELENDMNTANVSWKELTKKEGNLPFAQEVANVSQNSFANIEKNLQDYEGLIYDGPFSEHMTSTKPKGLGDKEYTEKEAREVIYDYIKKNTIKNINYNGEVPGDIATYSYNIELNNENMVYIDITKIGGHVLWMTYNKNIYDENINIDEAKKYALEFLENHGYMGMETSYYTVENGAVTINFAYTQSGVICYSDLVKVKVALDNGEILGFETRGYLNSHVTRKLEEPKIDVNEARRIINQDVEITSERLALIPTEWSTEVLTYEFKGKVDDRNFIVYVDANTGKEERVFLLIESENGILAI
ncbi:MAG: germination protein YpeB [Clostridia bacterium]|nr:germination protein YpeB [Clostridia bacterium]